MPVVPWPAPDGREPLRRVERASPDIRLTDFEEDRIDTARFHIFQNSFDQSPTDPAPSSRRSYGEIRDLRFVAEHEGQNIAEQNAFGTP